MRIHRLTLRSFRGVAEATIEPAPTGITIVQGDNEAGKSSLVEALDLLLDYRDDSQAASVRATKPVTADVGAFVEAELSAGPYRFTYSKRFHRDRATTLRISAPAPEQLTGREAHERVNAILDEHVDRQLWLALRLHQGVELDQADLSEGTSLAAALDTAASAGLGGDRESSLFQRVRAEYERYHTPKAGRPTRLVAAAAEAERAALERADALSTELDALDADVERDAALQKAIAAQRAGLVPQRARAEEARAHREVLERRRADLERLRLAAELAEADRRRAAEAVSERARLQSERSEQGAQLDAVVAAAAATKSDRAAAEERARHAEADVTRAREALEAARDRLRCAEEAREAVVTGDYLALLLERQQNAARAEDDLLEAQAAIESARVDDDALADIEAAERAVAAAEAALVAGAPTVSVHALAEVVLTVDGGRGRKLAAGGVREHRLAEGTVLQVGDLAEVSVRGAAGSQSHAERLAEATARLRQLCAHAGVGDAEDARRAHRSRAEAERAAAVARDRLRAALGEDTPAILGDRIRRLGERARVTPFDGTAEAADAAEDAVRDARKAVAEAEGLAEDASRARSAIDGSAAALRAELARLEREAQQLQRRSAELDERLAEVGSAEDLAAALDAAAVRARAAAAEQAAAATAACREDLDRATAAAEQAEAVLGRLSADLRSAEDERRDVRSRLELRGEQGLHDAFEAARRDHERAAAEHRRLRARAAAARLLYERMSANRDTARRAYAAPLRERLERLGRIVFGDDLRLDLDDDLRIARRTLDGVTLDYDQLSSGAREQLAVLARLAVAGIVGRPGVSGGSGPPVEDGGVPLILDDALGYADPGRLERLGAALRVGARDAQVIVLTCVPERYRHVGEATVVRL